VTTMDGERRRRGLAWSVLAAVLIALGAAAWLWVSNASTEAAPAAPAPVATATVERGTIALTESWEGTLDHGRPFTITSPTEGTITRLPDQGATIERGGELYRLNERPVILFYGAVPMYRNLGPGNGGADVEQLESNLTEFGYDGFTADAEYTAATAEAVRAWQADLGAEQTGTVARGEVVFVPEAGQVDALRAAVGDVVVPGRPILDLTGTDQLVSLEVDVDDRDRLEVGTEVTVVLPGGDEIAGAVGATAVVEVAPEGPEGSEGAAGSVLQVEISVREPAPDEVVGAPVEVVVAVDERADVLLVPVNALLALAEGGYGLEVVADDGSTSIVAVETGLFADGKVEVDSPEVTEGTVVGVAGR
jgi:peptidoglycan hydrolase-like protein with peptidoglycan-binding domain